ncbi:hypothetical protein B0H10DRAFT_2233650 [Mycena sp. CBHHK59/15]|nr:hypothetical protein B0H10DRAFT_2233650 [Mycena sp. CBHHK59/15]
MSAPFPMTSALFSVQELVDSCVDFMRDSAPDLHTAAPISRIWTHPAQMHIFSTIHLTTPPMTPSTSRRLLDVLEASPHLTQFTKVLSIHMWADNALLGLSQHHFTSLRQLSIVMPRHFSLPLCLAVQQLISLHSLEQLILIGDFTKDVYLHCSPSIKHLALWRFAFIVSPNTDTASPQSYQRPILHSFDLCDTDLPRVQWQDTLDLSKLKSAMLSNRTHE